MSWAKVDDQFHSHRKATHAWRLHPRALGLHLLAMSYCAAYLTDGYVDEGFAREKIARPKERQVVTDALVTAGLWDVEPGGWRIHDWLKYNPSAATVAADRKWDKQRKALFRDPELVESVRERDKNRCRYCGVLVNWKDRRGASGGSYDHVIPRGPNTPQNIVVACRRCNGRKNNRTPDEAQMPLLEPAGLVRSQLGTSPRSRSVQDTRPDPTRPIETPPSPLKGESTNGASVGATAPPRPHGKRKTDIDAWRAQMNAWGSEHFPGVDSVAIAYAVSWLAPRTEGPVTADDVRSLAASSDLWGEPFGITIEGAA